MKGNPRSSRLGNTLDNSLSLKDGRWDFQKTTKPQGKKELNRNIPILPKFSDSHS
jgi:hypothetical protein